MPISWNEIRHNSVVFAKEWAAETRESAEAKTFWDEFFGVFGVRRRVVASFEEPVRRITGEHGFIDLFWPGMLLVEHKSRGKDLGDAESQAFRYILDLADEGRYDEVPRYVIVSDFARVALHDLEPEDKLDLPVFNQFRVRSIEFPLEKFHAHIHDFAFIPGYKQHRLEDQDPINLKAVEILGDLHDALKDGGYTGHALERFLVRILFCLFAEDTGIFEREAFHLYIEQRTAQDGSDLGAQLAHLLSVLNAPVEKRQKNLDEILAGFQYINGELFSENLEFADFDRGMRDALLACTRFDWSRISPAVFGSLFQSVMEPRERRQLGGHYTSERDILKVIGSLFLDGLRAELRRAVKNKAELRRFHERLAGLRFLDPACGCGNFLVIAYRELRLLEIELLKALYGDQRWGFDVSQLSLIDVDAFCGIEISEWPARIAEVALWLMDHQMNLRLAESAGQYFVRLPLRKSPNIVCANALRIDWKKVLPPEKCSYVLGNPPFVGKHLMTAEQSGDMEAVWHETNGAGLLDYVTAWYHKAAEYILNTHILVGFVSTNSISQGEQVGILWTALFRYYHVKIHFAHRTFPWESEAHGKAHVHVVIIGFGSYEPSKKLLYEYVDGGDKVSVIPVKNISPYLIEGSNTVVTSRVQPICDVPPCEYGNKPTDGGFLIVEEEDREAFLAENPGAARYLRPLLCAEEYLHNIPRWCLWLVDAEPSDITANPGVKKRVQRVRAFRLASKKGPTRKKADEPALFAEIRQPKEHFLVVPQHTSQNRTYVPIGHFPPTTIIHNSCSAVPSASLYHFGVLSSAMHTAWVRVICGRIKSDYRYSTKLVYNNYPWPEKVTQERLDSVEKAAKAVLTARSGFPGECLANLYDPVAMPSKLSKAHHELDQTVDRCYRSAAFDSERQRLEFLFGLYAKYTAPLIGKAKRQSVHG